MNNNNGSYVAQREFKADGKIFKQGDPVPAEGWRNKNTLMSIGWIVFLPGIVPLNDKEVRLAGNNKPPAAPVVLPITYVLDNKATPDDDALTQAAKNYMELSTRAFEEAAAEINDKNVLELIIKLDDRKTIKETAQKRLNELEG